MRAAGFDVQAATVLSDGKRFKQEVQGETNLRKKKYDVLYESMFDLRSERNDPEDYFSFLVVVLNVHMIVPAGHVILRDNILDHEYAAKQSTKCHGDCAAADAYDVAHPREGVGQGHQ